MFPGVDGMWLTAWRWLIFEQNGPEDFGEDDFRRRIPRFSKENFPNILKLVGDLKKIGEKHGATAGQVALAWILSQGDDFIPIPGTKSVKVRFGYFMGLLP